MSDDAAKHFDETKPSQPVTENGRSVTQSVTLHPNGQIEFNLVAGNKILAYGLVEVMRAQLDKIFLSQEMKQAAAPTRNGVDGLLKRMNGG